MADVNQSAPASTDTPRSAESPFGPQRKWGPKPAPKPGVPGQRTTSRVTLRDAVRDPEIAWRLIETGRAAEHARQGRQRAQQETAAWKAHRATTKTPAATRLHQLATQAHTAPDLADYRSAA